MSDAKAFAAVVREFVMRKLGPINALVTDIAARIKALEDRPAPEKGDAGERGPVGEAGPAGKDGADGAPGLNGNDGAPGADGRDGAPGERGEAGERGADGAPGAHGADGKDGDAGINGRDGAPGRSAYELARDDGFSGDQAQWLASLRGADGAPGRDGLNGAPGLRGEAGERGETGLAGERGAAGQSVTAEDFRQLFEAEYAKWQLEWERRANDRLDRAVAALRVPRDGFSLEDFSVEHDGDGNVTLRFARGERVKEFTLRLPRFKDRGVYRDDEAYREGDGVTYAGSFWIAQKDDPQGRPDAGSGDFRLAVKRGRDGRDGVLKAAPAPAGPVRV